MSENNQENSVPFYPDHVALEAKVALGVVILVIIIGVIGLFTPVGLGAPADPMDTPAHIKPEWYFLALYQLLRYIPETIGATSPVLAIVLLIDMAISWIKNQTHRKKLQRSASGYHCWRNDHYCPDNLGGGELNE